GDGQPADDLVRGVDDEPLVLGRLRVGQGRGHGGSLPTPKPGVRLRKIGIVKRTRESSRAPPAKVPPGRGEPPTDGACPRYRSLTMSTQTPEPDVIDTVNEPRHPFGLPLGSVRGFMSLLICGFFWLVLLWPGDAVVKPLLGHFFLLALVLMAFASSPTAAAEGESSPFLPWLLRVLFVGGSVAVVLFCLFQYPERLQSRLTPDPDEFRLWWGPFLATLAIGFSAGLFVRFVL